MSTRGRSLSPLPPRDVDVDMENGALDKPGAKVVVVTNLSRNVAEPHLQKIFGFYGKILKVDLPVYAKSGQNRGKAAVEYFEPESAHKAASHMDGGQLDGAVLKVELSDLPVRTTRSRSPRPQRIRNGRLPRRSISRSRSRSRSLSPRFGRRAGPRYGEPFRRPPPGRRPPVRDTYRPYSRSRSRSPIRRAGGLGPRRRSPSYERGGYGRRGRSRSASYSVRSSRSRSISRSRSRSRSPSYSSYSRYSRSRSRSRSYSRGRRSNSRDDIRDSRSRSPAPLAPA